MNPRWSRNSTVSTASKASNCIARNSRVDGGWKAKQKGHLSVRLLSHPLVLAKAVSREYNPLTKRLYGNHSKASMPGLSERNASHPNRGCHRTRLRRKRELACGFILRHGLLRVRLLFRHDSDGRHRPRVDLSAMWQDPTLWPAPFVVICLFPIPYFLLAD